MSAACPRRVLTHLVSLLLIASGLASAAASDAAIDGGSFRVEVASSGVITAGPEAGLKNIDGPVVRLPASLTEWASYRYEDSAGLTWGVAAGNEPDYMNRQAVVERSFSATQSAATSEVRVGDLLVTTRFWFHQAPDALMVTVTLENAGVERMRGVFYTREWRVRPGDGMTFPDEFPVLGEIPRDVTRVVWMLDDLFPGKTVQILYSFQPDGTLMVPSGGVEVPLAFWTDAAFPAGLPIGDTNGVSFGDYDQDGYPDLLAAWSGNLWRNTGTGSWQYALDIDTLIPRAYRYGASFGDYDQNGFPDIATEPRTLQLPASCMALLKNLGGGANFQEVAGDPMIVDVPPCMVDAETNCFGDVDGDGELDLFVPCYPPWSITGGPGNFFFHNLGPTGPGGAHHFQEKSAVAGLDNPPGSARPEGAQFADVDDDGDIDLYSNGTLYQNHSTPGNPSFAALPEASSGILYSTILEEGSAFFDYDMDGDLDLFNVYESPQGVVLFESRGDGTFFQGEPGIIDANQFGIALGLSAVDWDNDGDIDLQTRQLFRRNQLVETGQRKFTLASNAVAEAHKGSATPAWADFDRDGDLDTAIGNWTLDGHFYENVLYGSSTPASDRRYVRIKPLRSSASAPQGLEVEYGARVDLYVHGDPASLRRTQFTASSAGYLTQNEYALHFGLPADPFPASPSLDLRFDVMVRFPSAPNAGAVTIGPIENPMLGGVHLADLTDREIKVFRDGRVVMNGCSLAPTNVPSTYDTFPPLVSADENNAIPPVQLAPTAGRSVGIEFDTIGAAAPVVVTHLIIDGDIATPANCSGVPMSLALWDVTQGGPATLVAGTTTEVEIQPRNDRHTVPVHWNVQPGAIYRLAALVDGLRPSPFAGPAQQGVINVSGGLNFFELSACFGLSVGSAAVDPNNVYLSMRYRQLDSPWVDLGKSKAGSTGTPKLSGTGSLAPGSLITLQMQQAAPSTPFAMVFGLRPLCAPLLGGTLVPNPDLMLFGFTSDASGNHTLQLTAPSGLPGGFPIYVQYLILDPSASLGLSLTNALSTYASG